MPHKLAFKIAHFSSEDNVMLARDLLQQGPSIRGWSSARYSSFPQELVLQLTDRSHLTKLQLLAHQFLIPEMIDLFIGDTPPGRDNTYYNAKFAQLGYVTLSDNEHTKFKARELKSINVDCTGTFLKLVFHKNYLNNLNVYNQVALVALNILGNEIEDNNNSVSPDGDGRRVPSKRVIKGQSPLNQDIAFAMYVDTHVADVITRMEVKREKANKDKRFEYAKKLRGTIEQLRLAGERLGKYEIEKRQAIDNENFDKAKLKKKQIEEYRDLIYNHFDVETLLEVKGRASSNDESGPLKELPTPPTVKKAFPSDSDTPDTTTASITPQTPSLYQASPSPRSSIPRPSPSSSSSRGPLPPPNTPPRPPPSPPKSPSPPPPKTPSAPLPGINSQRRPLTPSAVPKPRSHRVFIPQTPNAFKSPSPSSASSQQTAYTDYDERTLPALKHRSVQESPEDPSSSGGLRRTTLTEAEKKDAALPLQVFEVALVEKFYSKNYSDKERGLQLLQEEMEAYSYETSGVRVDRYTKAVVTLLRKSLRDKVYSVAVKASQTLSDLLINFFKNHRVSKKEIGTTLEKVLPDMLTKTADNAQRMQNLAVSAIMEMLVISLEKGVGGVGAELTRPLTQVVHPRSAFCRATIVENQLLKMNASSLPKDRESGFTVKLLVEFGLSALQHQNSDVRKCGERLLVTLYHHYPVAVRRALPMEDEPARRNVLFRNLFEQLEELDRKRHPSGKSKTATTPQHNSAQHQFQDFHQPAGAHAVQPVSFTSTPGGSSTSSGFSTASSTAGDRQGSNLPIISITPDEAEARGRTLSRLNSSRLDLREEDEDELMSPGEMEEKTCIFCGQFDETFSGSGLDLHYWKSCPLLTRCTFCKQVVEIAALSDHLLGECDSAKDFRRCERCTEAIPKFEIQRHVITAKCNVAKPTPLANHCPLCHENIPPWDGGWRKHLMPGSNSCCANPRTKPPGAKRSESKTFDKSAKESPEGGRRNREKKSSNNGTDIRETKEGSRDNGRKYNVKPNSGTCRKSFTSKKR